MRLLIVQYAGDYREAVYRFSRGEKETYYAQKYSVDTVAEITKQAEEVAVICCMTTEPYNEVLENRVRAIGAGFHKKIQVKKLLKLIEDQNPTHLIIRTPILEVFRWSIKKRIPTIAMFAESASTRGLQSKLRNYSLANLLKNDYIEWVGCYGINSSISFQKIGIQPDKIIPWDFIVTEKPDSFPPKYLCNSKKTWNLFYIGTMIKSKGVGDILEAISKLKAKNFPVSLQLAGRDEKEFFLNKARQLQIEDCVEFLGLVPNSSVVSLMREADVVLVPSHHEYPEGFPLAITHALCSRTPIITSDHPMFIKILKHGINALIFPAKSPSDLSENIEKLLSNQEIYKTLSEASSDTWTQLQVPVKWDTMINYWLYQSPKNQQWLFEHRLSSGRYNSNVVINK
jgi:glycosyltransferase involved in cell wall biosynthesis